MTREAYGFRYITDGASSRILGEAIKGRTR